MEQTNSTKKIILAAILTSGLALAITQSALAQPGYQGKRGGGPCQVQLDPATQKAQEKFLAETVETRKKLMEKKAVMRALINAGSQDTAKVGQLAGEVFELREQLRVKAADSGLPLPMLMGHGGAGMGAGMGPGCYRGGF